MTNVCIYIRYSSAEQQENSADRQRANLVDTIEKNGWTLTKEYIEPHFVEGDDFDNRIAWPQLLEDCNSDDWDIVCVDDSERITRAQGLEASLQLIHLQRAEKQVYYRQENRLVEFNDATSLMVSSILEQTANMDNSRRASKTITGALSKINKGIYKADPIYGFACRTEEQKDIRLQHCPDYGKHVQYIFKTFIELKHIFETVDHLNRKGVPTLTHRRRKLKDERGNIKNIEATCVVCGKKENTYSQYDVYKKRYRQADRRRNLYRCDDHLEWDANSLKQVLTNILYIGKTTFGKHGVGKLWRLGEDGKPERPKYADRKKRSTRKENYITVEDVSIPLVSEEDFSTAQRLLSKQAKIRKPVSGKPSTENRFNQTIICTKCNKPLIGKQDGPKKSWAYKCLTYLQNPKQDLCHTSDMWEQEVEDIICYYVQSYFFEDSFAVDVDKTTDIGFEETDLDAAEGLSFGFSGDIKLKDVYGAVNAHNAIQRIIEAVEANRGPESDIDSGAIEKKIRDKKQDIKWKMDLLISDGQYMDKAQTNKVRQEINNIDNEIKQLENYLERALEESVYDFSPAQEAILLYLQVHEDEFVVSDDGYIFHKDDTRGIFPVMPEDKYKVLEQDKNGKLQIANRGANIGLTVKKGHLEFRKVRGKNRIFFESEMTRDERRSLTNFALDKLVARIHVDHKWWETTKRRKSEVTNVWVEPRLPNGAIGLLDRTKKVATKILTLAAIFLGSSNTSSQGYADCTLSRRGRNRRSLPQGDSLHEDNGYRSQRPDPEALPAGSEDDPALLLSARRPNHQYVQRAPNPFRSRLYKTTKIKLPIKQQY